MKTSYAAMVRALGRALRPLLVGAMLAFGLAQPARADTTYTYNGNPFTIRLGTLPPPCSGVGVLCEITGSFTFPTPLTPNSTFGFLTPTSFTFTDGSNTYSSTNIFLGFDFSLTTDATGGIVAPWDVKLTLIGTPGIQMESVSTGGLFGSFDSVSFTAFPPFQPAELITQNSNSPGTWTMRGPAVVPEPTTFLLLGTGLLGLGTMVWRRKQIA